MIPKKPEKFKLDPKEQNEINFDTQKSGSFEFDPPSFQIEMVLILNYQSRSIKSVTFCLVQSQFLKIHQPPSKPHLKPGKHKHIKFT